MKFKKLKSQSGRSMVEMLGVLAIIGVLSVGGIAGYSLSMRKHRANGVIDLASKYALLVYGQYQQKISNGEIEDKQWFEPLEDAILFENADIGSLPAGVTKFEIKALSISSTTPFDSVHMDLSFSDQKLCQAVASIAGSTCNKGTVSMKIKQN